MAECVDALFNLGKVNNQRFVFVYVSFNPLIEMIQYKAEESDIAVIVREESYTSKLAALDFDPTGTRSMPMLGPLAGKTQ